MIRVISSTTKRPFIGEHTSISPVKVNISISAFRHRDMQLTIALRIPVILTGIVQFSPTKMDEGMRMTDTDLSNETDS